MSTSALFQMREEDTEAGDAVGRLDAQRAMSAELKRQAAAKAAAARERQAVRNAEFVKCGAACKSKFRCSGPMTT